MQSLIEKAIERDKSGYKQEAMCLYNQVLDTEPDNREALNNKAALLYEEGSYGEALTFCDRVLAVNAKYRPALINKANSLYMLKKIPEAMDIYLEIIKLYPEELSVRQTIADIYDNDEDYENSARQYLYLIEKGALVNEDIYINLASELYMMTTEHKNKEAVKMAKIWLKHTPENPIALHTAASLGVKGVKKPAQLNQQYVKNVFDAFASSFENVLNQLEYKSPFLVSEAWRRYAKNNTDILDAGCGSGLCGKWIYKHNPSVNLCGVDISAKMLEKAKEKNIYKKLYESELISFFESNNQKFNCIISADVFTYFGNIEYLFALIAKNISDNGVFIFTITLLDSYFTSYKLEKSGRYMHSCRYIEKNLKKAGFTILAKEKDVMRYEAEKPVFGMLFAARKNTEK